MTARHAVPPLRGRECSAVGAGKVGMKFEHGFLLDHHISHPRISDGQQKEQPDDRTGAEVQELDAEGEGKKHACGEHVHGPFESHGNNASSLMRFIHVVAAPASPKRKDSGSELDTPSSPPPSRELPVVLTWCSSECQFESRMDRGMFIFRWSMENL